MLALCLMLSGAYYAKNYAGIIDLGLFVMAKSCVASLKSQTLPQLELMAALIAARLTKFVKDSLQIAIIPIYVWVVSQIVLYWIHSQKKLPQFVAHRVTEIHLLIPSVSCKYCPSHTYTQF